MSIKSIVAFILNFVLWGAGYLFLGVKRKISLLMILSCIVMVVAFFKIQDGVFHVHDTWLTGANLLMSFAFGLDAFMIGNRLKQKSA